MMTEEQIKVTTDWLKKQDISHTVVEVGVVARGDMVIEQRDRVHLPALAEVSGYVDVQQGATFEAPALAEVSGSVDVRQGATFEAPALAKSGSVYVWQGATFEAPALRTVEHLSYETEFFGNEIEVFDGIGTVTQSTKTLDGITIRKCRKASFEDGELVGETMYVVSRGDHHAHGEAVKEAIADLSFKEADKDASKYRGMSLDTEKSVEDWIVVYRVVTGSCRLGVQDFINRQGELKETYTLDEVIKMTEGEYQSDRFKEIVAA